MDDRHLTVNEIANTVGISLEQVQNILQYQLGMAERWVPLLLMPDQRLTMSQANPAIFEADQASYLDHFLIQDESWGHHSEQETKRQSMQRKHPGSPPPRTTKVISSAG